MTHNPKISLLKFKEVFDQFPEFIRDHSGGREFSGFSNGYLHERESYKTRLREQSLEILKTVEWKGEWIGEGKILKRVIETFELEDNNLVGTNKRFGEESVPHRKMIRALEDKADCASVEQVLFDHFNTDKKSEDIFKLLIDLIGKQYSVIAFLFFLKNDRKYLPISTSNFEHAFKLLGCELTLSRKCSWKNYEAYLSVISEVKSALELSMDESINLIDAHSYCWLLGYKNSYQEWFSDEAVPAAQAVFNAFEIEPINMSSNQEGSRTSSIKVKEADMDWDKKDKLRRINGRRAEELVLEFEKHRLNTAGYQNLARKVEDYSEKHGIGYDVQSWNEDGTERNVEVKSSNGNSFIITRNELQKAETNPNFWIYIVAEKSKEVQIKMIKSPSFKDESQFKLEPKDYYVSFSES